MPNRKYEFVLIQIYIHLIFGYIGIEILFLVTAFILQILPINDT